MDVNLLGRVGEAKVIAALSEQGWYPFLDISGKSPVDLIAWKNGRPLTIQIKSTTQSKNNSWQVETKRVRINTKGSVQKGFEQGVCDFLAVYIEPIDVVCFVPSLEVPAQGMRFVEEKNRTARTKRVVEDYLLLDKFV